MSAGANVASHTGELAAFLRALVGSAGDELVELRFRRPGGPMRQRFHPASRLAQAAETAVWLARRHDVYVGCAPRRRRAGGRGALGRLRALWADCDTEEAVDRQNAFEPAPTIVVRSGSAANRHAYWALNRTLEDCEAERLNRRLAHALGADAGAVTRPAAILRPPGTLNHKHQPARPVVLERLTGELLTPGDLAASLPDPPANRQPERRRSAARERDDDPLLKLAPAAYVEALTGLRPSRAGKVSCPFHEDAIPSLHAYPTAAQGWYCFRLRTRRLDLRPRCRGCGAATHKAATSSPSATTSTSCSR